MTPKGTDSPITPKYKVFNIDLKSDSHPLGRIISINNLNSKPLSIAATTQEETNELTLIYSDAKQEKIGAILLSNRVPRLIVNLRKNNEDGLKSFTVRATINDGSLEPEKVSFTGSLELKKTQGAVQISPKTEISQQKIVISDFEETQYYKLSDMADVDGVSLYTDMITSDKSKNYIEPLFIRKSETKEFAKCYFVSRDGQWMLIWV